MIASIARFQFAPHVREPEIESLLAIACCATEGLYGTTRLEVEDPLNLDLPRGVVTVDVSGEGGRDLAAILLELAREAVGAGSVTCERSAPSGDSASSTEVTT